MKNDRLKVKRSLINTLLPFLVALLAVGLLVGVAAAQGEPLLTATKADQLLTDNDARRDTGRR